MRELNKESALDIQTNDLKNLKFDIFEEFEKQFYYTEQDTGIKHNKAHLKIDNTGSINMWAQNSRAGIVLNSHHNTVNCFGDAINVNAHKLNISVLPEDLFINNHYINPEFMKYSGIKNPPMYNRTVPMPGIAYMDDLKVKCTARWWCPGSPNLCGKTDSEGNPINHRGHWIIENITLPLFLWKKPLKKTDEILTELGIPLS